MHGRPYTADALLAAIACLDIHPTGNSEVGDSANMPASILRSRGALRLIRSKGTRNRLTLPTREAKKRQYPINVSKEHDSRNHPYNYIPTEVDRRYIQTHSESTFAVFSSLYLVNKDNIHSVVERVGVVTVAVSETFDDPAILSTLCIGRRDATTHAMVLNER